jgi:hypothetical protein
MLLQTYKNKFSAAEKERQKKKNQIIPIDLTNSILTMHRRLTSWQSSLVRRVKT